MLGRKHQPYAAGQAPRLGGRKGSVQRGVQVVAHPRQRAAQSCARRAQSTAVRRAVDVWTGRGSTNSQTAPAPCRAYAQWRDILVALAAASAFQPTTVWIARPCNSRNGAPRRVARRGPALLSSGSQRPLRASGDTRVAPDSKSSVCFFSMRRTVSYLIRVTPASVSRSRASRRKLPRAWLAAWTGPTAGEALPRAVQLAGPRRVGPALPRGLGTLGHGLAPPAPPRPRSPRPSRPRLTFP